MKVLVINDEGVQVEVKPEQIVVKGITLDKLFNTFNNSFKEFKEFKAKMEKREEGLIETWQKIK